MNDIREYSQGLKRLDQIMIIGVGVTIMTLVTLGWIDAESALLLLFLIGAFFPLSAVFITVITIPAIRAVKARNIPVIILSGVSIAYMVIWGVTLKQGIYSYSEFRTSFVIFASLVYSLWCFATVIVAKYISLP